MTDRLQNWLKDSPLNPLPHRDMAFELKVMQAIDADRLRQSILMTLGIGFLCILVCGVIAPHLSPRLIEQLGTWAGITLSFALGLFGFQKLNERLALV